VPLSRLYCSNEYFQPKNTDAPLIETISIEGTLTGGGYQGSNRVAAATKNVILHQTPSAPEHDGDGNLLADGRWAYTWNALNQMIGIETAHALTALGLKGKNLNLLTTAT